jgi:hypothetical protein
MTSGNECGGPLIGPVGSGDTGSLFGEDLVGSSTLVPSGSEAGWQFTAPAGTVITGVSYYRAIDTAVGAADWQAGLFAANGTSLDICQTDPSPCSEPNNQVPVVLSGLNTSGLFFGIYCDSTSPSECDPGATLHYAQAQLYSISVTLSETGLPSLSSLGGSLWGGGALWGTGTVTFSASDPSGISQVALDGPAGQAGLQPQVCDYAETQPCPDLPSGSMSVNTTLLHDGPQTLTLLVTNAAGNTTSAVSPSVVIDNNGPPAPAQLTASAIAGSTAAVQLTWSDPANPPEPVASAEAEVCQASCGPAVALNSSGSAQVPVTGPGTYGVRLWLLDSAGRGGPANAATASVTVTVPTPPPLPALTLSHRRKGRDLTLTAKVPKGVEGRVTFTLRAYRGTRRVALITRHVRPTHGSASLRLVLSEAAVTASKISVSVAASHARGATLTFRP